MIGTAIASNPATSSVASGTVLALASLRWGTTEVVRSIVLLLSCVVIAMFLRLIGERIYELRKHRLSSTTRYLLLDSGVLVLAASETARQASSLHAPFRWWIPLEGIGLALVIVGVYALHRSFEERRAVPDDEPVPPPPP